MKPTPEKKIFPKISLIFPFQNILFAIKRN